MAGCPVHRGRGPSLGFLDHNRGGDPPRPGLPGHHRGLPPCRGHTPTGPLPPPPRQGYRPTATTPKGNPKSGGTESVPKFLQWLNAAPAAHEPDSAKSFHLNMNLACVTDGPGPDFPGESLYSQWEHLMRNAAWHPTWGFAVQAFLVQQSMEHPFELATVAVSDAVTAAQSQTQAAASSGHTTSRGGAADADCLPIAVYIP